MYPIRMSAKQFLTEGFCGFTQSLQANAGIILKWATAVSTYIRSISSLIIRDAKKAVKYTVNNQISE
jgi:hypothetical protein